MSRSKKPLPDVLPYEEPCRHRTTRTEKVLMKDEYGDGYHVVELEHCTDKCKNCLG